MTSKPLHEQFGETTIDHFVVHVRYERMASATYFFVVQLGWMELLGSRITGDWGSARFVIPKTGDVKVQLTEPASQSDSLSDEVHHVALKVKNPAAAADLIAEWAHRVGTHCKVEPANDGKVFVNLRSLFVTGFELVPLSNS